MKDSDAYNKKRKKITWVTPDFFLDTDFNPELFSGILKFFDIYWIVLLPSSKARFSEKDFERFNKCPGITIKFIYWTSRARSLKTILFYEKVYQCIKSSNPDLVYFNYVPTNPYVLLLYWRLNKRKTIVTAHDGNVKSSFKMPLLSRLVFKLAYSRVKFVNMFSETQKTLFKSTFNKAKIYLTPLGLKDFGVSALQKRDDYITFFFFGSINKNKNLGLLIDAACNLYDKGLRGFKISINGYCTNWDYYKSKISHPDLFECDIRMIKNSEIADLFAKNHYAVFPYNEMSQSGSLKVAFNYCTPVIVTNLKGFTDEVKDGVNGFIFESKNLNDLESLMTERVINYSKEYQSLVNKIYEYNNEHYSKEASISKYLNMFNEVIAINQ